MSKCYFLKWSKHPTSGNCTMTGDSDIGGELNIDTCLELLKGIHGKGITIDWFTEITEPQYELLKHRTISTHGGDDDNGGS